MRCRRIHHGERTLKGVCEMAAMKPRTGDGPLEAAKEGRGIVVRIPIEGGGRLVVELTADEAAALGEELRGVTG
ncbi:hypothetical protein ABW18_08250 [Gordonia jacobaea]|nr:hypothetical protein ABW18_08250 [Gordonia jacobaea]